MSSGEHESRLSYIETAVQKYGKFDVDRIPLRFLFEYNSHFEKELKYVESVIASETFCDATEIVQSQFKTFRLKLRVDIHLIKERIGNCSDPELLHENSENEIDR